MKRVVFRAEASPSIGGGHVFRCLSLARQMTLNGWDCTFLATAETFRFLHPSVFDGMGTERLRPGDFGGHLSLSTKPDVVVFDLYSELTETEREWSAHGAGVVVIDDLRNQFHHADILLNQNDPSCAPRYAGFVTPECRLLCGPRYALLRSDFARLRPLAEERWRMPRTPSRIFISFGLTDPTGMCLLALKALERVDTKLHVDIVVGSGTPHLVELKSVVANSKLSISLHIDTQDVARLMLEADFAIAAGGGSSWERCTLALPTIVIPVADNQLISCETLESAGAAINIGLVTKGISTRLESLVDTLTRDGIVRSQMGLAAMKLCDGKGAQRVAAEIDGIACKFV